MNLNDNQKNEFWEYGFITINSVFSESFVDKLCSALESSSVLNEINNIHIKDGGHSLELTIINPIFLQLAKDKNLFKKVKTKVSQNKFSSKLFNTKEYVMNLERGFKLAHDLKNNKNEIKNIYI